MFNFPGCRDKQGCCHLRKCKPEELRNCETDKAYKAHEKLPHTLMSWILETEGSMNARSHHYPILAGLVAQFVDILGNLLLYLVHRKMEGSNLTDKVRALFKKIQEYCKTENMDSKPPTLSLLMI